MIMNWYKKAQMQISLPDVGNFDIDSLDFIDNNLIQKLKEKIIERIGNRNVDILKLYFAVGQPDGALTMAKIAQKYGMSITTVRKIIDKAIREFRSIFFQKYRYLLQEFTDDELKKIMYKVLDKI